MKAGEEARKKADEEARIKADEEARMKAGEEARIKAEEEALAKAETESPPAEKARETRAHAEILAEKFLTESSINENLAGNRKPDVDAKVIGKPIDNISRNIGINDRFLIIRELFDGNADPFKQLLGELDQAGSLDMANSILDSTFDGEKEHEGLRILSNLVKRRYPSS
jgi:hypothetical protein